MTNIHLVVSGDIKLYNNSYILTNYQPLFAYFSKRKAENIVTLSNREWFINLGEDRLSQYSTDQYKLLNNMDGVYRLLKENLGTMFHCPDVASLYYEDIDRYICMLPDNQIAAFFDLYVIIKKYHMMVVPIY